MGVCLLLLAGCIAETNGSKPKASVARARETIDQVATQPNFEPGHAFMFDDGRIEEVIGVDRDRVRWTDGAGFNYTTTRDVLQPRVAWADSEGWGARDFLASDGTLWPLAVGNHVQFTTERTEQPTEGRQTTTVERWSCAVEPRQQLDTKAGSFDVWRVVCDFTGQQGDLSGGGRRVFYYAPAIGYYVRRDDIDARGVTETIELVEFRTADPNLPTSAQRARSRALQATLETEPSGSSVVWQSGDDQANGEVSPTRTFRAALARYCRDYEERIDWQGRLYHVLATACRDRRGRWEVAQQEAPSQKVESRALRPGG